jgi:hypothetical protein
MVFENGRVVAEWLQFVLGMVRAGKGMRMCWAGGQLLGGS